MNRQQAIIDIGIREASKFGIVFEKKYMRRAMTILGREVQKEARGLVSHGGGSKPDTYPGKISGKLGKSIGYRVSRPGFLVTIAPRRAADFGGKEFYPAFLHYGVHKAKRRKDHKAHPEGTPFRVAPRKNYMTDALEHKKDRVRAVILEAVTKGLHA